MSLVEDFDEDLRLVDLPVVPQFLPHAAEDLGEGALAQAFFLEDTRTQEQTGSITNAPPPTHSSVLL